MQSHGVKIEGGRIFRFSLVGICATFVYILVSILANEIFRITPVLASILAQIAGFVVILDTAFIHSKSKPIIVFSSGVLH
jgi:putative flippase GtrA